MSANIEQAVNEVRQYARLATALQQVVTVLDGIASLESEEARLRSLVGASKAQLIEAQAATVAEQNAMEGLRAQSAELIADARAEAERIVIDANARADTIMAEARDDAQAAADEAERAVQAKLGELNAANEKLTGIKDQITLAEAEFARVNNVIAEARARLGAI